MTVVGSATVEIRPDAAGFGPKTEAAVKRALAGIRASIELQLDENGLRQKISAAVKAATSGSTAKIGTELDVAPIKGKVRQALADAAQEATSGGPSQLDLFDVDPAELVAQVEAAKAAAQAALRSGRQLQLEFDVDNSRLEAAADKASDVLTRALRGVGGMEQELKLSVDRDFSDGDRMGTAIGRAVQKGLSRTRLKLPPIDAGGGGSGGSADRVGAAAGGIFGRAVLRSAARVLAAGGLAQIFTAATAGVVAMGGALISATGATASLAATAASLPAIFSAAAQAAASIGFALSGVGGALKAYGAMQKSVGKAAAGGGGGGDNGASARAAERAIRNASRGVEDAERSMAEAVEAASERIIEANEDVIDAQQDLQEAYEDGARRIEDAQRAVADAQRAVADAQEGLARAQEESARRIVRAQKAVTEAVEDSADAQEDLVRAQEDGQRRVESSERDLARSHRAVQEAQEDLTRARAQAREEIEDLRRSVARLALTEDEARRRLAEAQQKNSLAAKRASQDLTGVTEETLAALERQAAMEDKAAENPRAKAANELRDAELDLQEATAKRLENETKLAEADRTGVEGTERVINARERLGNANEAVAQNERDLRDAQLDAARQVVRAQERVADSYDKITESQQALVDAQRDGARQVIDAQQSVADSFRDLADAERDLQDAHKDTARAIADATERVEDAYKSQRDAERDLVRAHEDGARRIADAQEALADAIASAAESAAGAAGGAAGAIDAYEAALARLSPAARQFVEFLISLEPILRRVQATAAAGLFPGLEQAIRVLLPLVDDLEPIIGDTAFAMAGLAIAGADLIASPAFRGDLITVGRRNIDLLKTFGSAAISLGSSLRHIMVEAGPLTQHIANLAERYAFLIERSLTLNRESGALAGFFDRVSDRLDRLLVTAEAFGNGLFRVFRDATPAGDAYLDTLTRLAVKFDILTDRASKSGAMRDFFESTRPAVEAVAKLLGDVTTGLFNIGSANLGNFTAFVDQLRTQLLPVLLEILGTIDTDFLSALVSLTTGVANLFGALLVGNPTLTLFVEVLGDMADGISTLLTDIPVLSPILQGLVTAFGALAVIGAVTALKQFASSIFGVEKALLTITGSADKAALSATRVGSAFDKAGAILGRAFLIAGIVLAAKAAVDALAPSIDKVVASVVRSKDPLAEFEKGLNRLNNPGLFDKIGLALKSAFDNPIKTIITGLPGIGAAFTALGGNAVKYGETSTKAFEKVAQASQATALRIIADAKAQGQNTQEYERILESLIQEQAQQNIAQEEVSKRVAEATAAYKGNNAELERHIQRMRDATQTALTLSGAETNTEEAVDNLTASIEKNGLTFDSNTEKGRENRRMLDSVVAGLSREIEELGKAAQAGQLDNERKDALLGHLNNLANSGYPGAKQAAERLRLELESIQQTYTANVDLDTTNATIKLNNLEARLEYLAKVGVSAENNINRGTAGDPDAREFGGRVLRNRAYIVGERRPELFIPDENGVILPQVPDLAVPKGLGSTLGDANLMPSGTRFDMDGLVRSLEALEASLTEQLAAANDKVDETRREAATTTDSSTHVEQTITGPLVTIDATFGPGSSVDDLMAAFEQLADDRIAQMLIQILKDRSAGVGTRGPS